MLKRLMEIKRRKAELRAALNTLSGDALSDAIKEVDKLDKESTDLELRMKDEQDIETRSNPVQIPGVKVEQKSYGVDSPEYRSAFFKNLAGVELNDAEKRAMNTNANSAGAAVPTSTLNKILEKLQDEAIVYPLVSVSNLRGNVVIPVEGNTADVERKGEGEDAALAEDTLESIALGAKKYIKLVKLTCELEATSIDALENYVVDKLVKKFTLAFDEDIISGDGVKKMTGILNTITPLETADAGAISYDDVCKLFGALKAIAKRNATLMMSTDMLYTKIATIKDTNGRPIFDITNGKVLGRTVLECDTVPSDTIIFGDFSTYQLNWNKPVEITKSQEAAFASGDVVYRGLALVDGKLADLGAMKVLKIKAGTTTKAGTSKAGEATAGGTK